MGALGLHQSVSAWGWRAGLIRPWEGFSSPGERSSKDRAHRGLAEVYLFILLAPLTAPKQCRQLPCFLLSILSPRSPRYRILSPDTGLPSSRHPNKHKVSWSQALALAWQGGPEISCLSESRQVICLPWALVYPPTQKTNSHMHQGSMY